jgi:hypothetical protein
MISLVVEMEFALLTPIRNNLIQNSRVALFGYFGHIIIDPHTAVQPLTSSRLVHGHCIYHGDFTP